MDIDEYKSRKPIEHEIGCELDNLSVEELKSRIILMEQEIKRLEISINAKNLSRSDADTFFKN